MLDIAILEGIRTPFVKAYGVLGDVPAQELGRRVTRAVLERADVRPEQVDQVVFGNVATPPDAANVARVIAQQAGLPTRCIAHTVHRNCASGMEAITTAAQLIQLGEARTVVAGGTESMSQIPLLFSREAAGLFHQLARAKTVWSRLRTLARFRPRHFRPVPGVLLGLKDPISGLFMGETAEVLAEEFGISREEQDAYALESHRRAVASQQQYVLDAEITPLFLEEAGQEVKEDVGPRRDQSGSALARFKPFFKKDGTVTVGNSCSLTDGAAAVVLMPGEAARAEGRIPLGYLRAFAYTGCDPRRMGLGPAFATAKLLERTGLDLKDFDLIELNEAFAAQVIANERAFASDQFARQELGRETALGVLERDRLNVNGGAISLGHPISATGVRLVITLLKELRRRGLKRGLATVCVGGGQGAALVVEAPPQAA
jgi:acetyl-CoA C-acetyltransferase/acetyl-CoA acyltransferase